MQRSFHSSRSVAAKDPYQVLGVGKDATSPDVKKAYYAVSCGVFVRAQVVGALKLDASIFFHHQLAKKYHPDSNKDKAAQAKFVEIQEAYDVRPLFFRIFPTGSTHSHTFGAPPFRFSRTTRSARIGIASDQLLSNKDLIRRPTPELRLRSVEPASEISSIKEVADRTPIYSSRSLEPSGVEGKLGLDKVYESEMTSMPPLR